MLTVSGALNAPLLSVTTSEKVSVVSCITGGTMKVGWAVVALLSSTEGPAA